MKFAVVSDIHGNLEAFQTTLEYLHQHHISKIICLGDLVGYGPNPNECVELAQKHCTATIMGNHDHAVLGLTDIDYFNEYARAAVLWTRRVLHKHLKGYLENLSMTYEEGDFLFVHSSPVDPSEWYYIFSEVEARQNFKAVPHRVIFIGHSHVPLVFSLREGRIFKQLIGLNIETDRYILNVGSVGQPRDGDPRSCFVIIDDEALTAEYVRLEYPVEKTYQKIVNAGLPHFLAQRILVGQ